MDRAEWDDLVSKLVKNGPTSSKYGVWFCGEIERYPRENRTPFFMS